MGSANAAASPVSFHPKRRLHLKVCLAPGSDRRSLNVKTAVRSGALTHVLPVSGQMGELHHLVAELAEDLDEFLEGADSFQMLQGNQDLAGGKGIGSAW